MLLLDCLAFIGSKAVIILPLGILIALLTPTLDFHPQNIITLLIVLIYSSAFVRLDLKEILLSALRPARLAFNLLLSFFILIFIPCCVFYSASFFGLNNSIKTVLLWYAVAPPIASTVWMCLLLGFKPALAMELVIITSLISPFSGPFIAYFLLDTHMLVSPIGLFSRLAIMICGGILIAIIGQKIIGKKNIETNSSIFDGISAVAMVCFLIPVFNGMSIKFFTNPNLALQLFMLALALNFGCQLILILVASMFKASYTKDGFRVMAVITGNRNVGLYYAALPPDPVMGLFTAVYQIPLYFTPLFLNFLNKFRKSYFSFFKY